MNRRAELTCPQCGAITDAEFDMTGTGRTPQPDDISQCVYCAAINIFTTDDDGALTFRTPTSDELDEILKHPAAQAAAVALAQVRAKGLIPPGPR